MSEISANGLQSWQTRYRDASTLVGSSSQTTYGTGGSRWVTNTMPDGSYAISAYSYGFLVSATQYDSTGAQIGGASYTYDAHGRQSDATDARNGTTSYSYNNADLVTSVTSPAPGSGGSAQTTTTYFNNSLQATNVLQPDGTSVSMAYLPTGELWQTYGSRTYPAAYSYDYAGRKQTMTNWSNFGSGGGARVTTWNYDSYRGFLTGKTDAAGQTVSYGYTGAGRLSSRIWARGTSTTYSYNTAGDLAKVIYSDGTPGMTNNYDQMGRISSVVNGATTTSFVYDLANDVLSESYAGGILNGLTVTNQFDLDLRRTTMALMNGSSSLCQSLYGYDHASRLASVSDGTNSATYSYLANSPLVSQIVFASNTVTRMTTSKQYDYLNRLSSISSSPSNAFTYAYNAANQRTMNRLWDSSYWRYGYDALGQVISGNKYWADQTPVAGQQFDYTFDTIGNRTQTQAGGDQNGANLRVANYTNNTLNQITSRDAPGYVDIMGDGLATNGVTVNGQTAYRKNEYFRQQLSVTNTTSAVWDDVTVAATGQTSVTGHIYVAQTPESYTYDLDGNLLSDGRWNYVWDGENRLISLTSFSGAPTGSMLQLAFNYDYQGRRIQKILCTNNGTNYVGQYTNNYAYDGWNCVALLNSSSSLLNSFLWGSDLSGSIQGAGGVGGLIEVTYYGAATTNCFIAFDGNGNVSTLVNAANGTTVANYDYGPFGEVIRATGPLAKLNPFRFSTKYDDDETDFLYYGCRYYNPSAGRWIGRDPEEEDGGLNLYGFSGNDAIDSFDVLGLAIVCSCPESYFAANGIGTSMFTKSGDTYSAVGTTGPTTGDGLILWRMLLSSQTFKADGLKVANLMIHVAARNTIVTNALAANFTFGAGSGGNLDPTWIKQFNADPQGFFNKINNGGTIIACNRAAYIIFQTGNKFNNPGRRNYDRVWIPGDWGYINNTAYSNDGDWNTPDGQNGGLQGENVFNTGNDLFWGLFTSGVHPAQSESAWWAEVQRWKSRSGKYGIPAWRSYIEYPSTGLQQ